MPAFTPDQWLILLLTFLLGLILGMALIASPKWKRRYRDEVRRREALETENEQLRRDAREMDSLRQAAARDELRHREEVVRSRDDVVRDAEVVRSRDDVVRDAEVVRSRDDVVRDGDVVRSRDGVVDDRSEALRRADDLARERGEVVRRPGDPL